MKIQIEGEFLQDKSEEFKNLQEECYSNFDLLLQGIKRTNWSIQVKQAITKYNLQQYKLDNITPEFIKGLYEKLKPKYQKMINSNGRIYWLQNQLKIFIWLSIAVSHYLGVDFGQYGQNQIKRIRQSFLFLSEGLATYQYKLSISSSFEESWSSSEEALLTNLVTKYEYNGSWTTISKELFLESGLRFLRTAHLCRQKWQNHLDTRLVKGLWTVEQDYSIIKNRLALGKKWSLIAKVFGPVRTEHMIKNRYKTILKRETTKREIRSIEEVSICKQIENKLFLQLNSLTSPTSTATGTSDAPDFKEMLVKFNDEVKQECINEQHFLNQQLATVKLQYFQQTDMINYINQFNQNLSKQSDIFFQTIFEQNHIKIPYVESFQIPNDLHLIQQDFKYTNAFLEDHQYDPFM